MSLNSKAKLALACCLTLTLAGCVTSGSIKPTIPALPAKLAAACTDPGVRSGKDAREELARNRQALADCSRRHRDTVRFGTDVQKGIGR